MRIPKRSNNILIRISASILEALIFNNHLIKSEESVFYPYKTGTRKYHSKKTTIGMDINKAVPGLL
jgi:hypothetical protein